MLRKNLIGVQQWNVIENEKNKIYAEKRISHFDCCREKIKQYSEICRN